ncbi:MAG: GUN4 domain-containing protein [Rivularia sp. (in: Bacteria)]|nr:GUN4 domain-containing protein [Rivularia sp. MS3]
MKKLALLIGISEYKQYFSPLSKAEKDVDKVQTILQDSEVGRFYERDITVSINDSEQKIQAYIYELFANKNADDLLLMYFSGHALINNKGNLFFAATDTKKYDYGGELIESTAIPASFIKERMDASKSRNKVIIIDCCYSETFRSDSYTKNKVDIEAELGDEGRAILISSDSIDYHFKEDKELSTYTNFLVKGIKEGVAASDNDGWITLAEIHQYITSNIDNVPNMAPQLYSSPETKKINLAKVDIKSVEQKTVVQTIHLDGIELKSQRQVDYSRLRDYLIAQNWQQADIETRRVLRYAAGKQESEFLVKEDIRHISCLDLSTIDNLWVEASKGRFGFSAQKDVWKQIVTNIDYETDCEVGYRLGWRINNSWLIHSQLTFSLKAPIGHFPCLGVSLVRLPGSFGGLFRDPIFSYILQRFTQCEV